MSVPITGGDAGTLASGQDSPHDIVTTGSQVYWTNDDLDGSVMKYDIPTAATTAIAFQQAYPTGIAVAGPSLVYWTSSPDAGGGAVMMFNGTSSSVLVPNQQSPQGIKLDPMNLYWVSIAPGPTIWSVPQGGGDASILGAIPAGNPVGPIALAGTIVYWTNTQPQYVERVSIDGGGATPLGPSSAFLSGIAADGTRIYFGAGNPGPPYAVFSMLPDGTGNAGLVYLGGSERAIGLAVDGTSVYYTTTLGNIWKVAKP
jgi:hypothetical protein